MTSHAWLLLASVAACSPAPTREPQRPQHAEHVVAPTQPVASAESTPRSPEHRPTELVGRWLLDVQAHADLMRSDRSEKELFLALVRSHLEMLLENNGTFALRVSSGDESRELRAKWRVERVAGNEYWVTVYEAETPQERPTGQARIVLRDANHLEYYKQLQDPAGPKDDHVVYYMRAAP